MRRLACREESGFTLVEMIAAFALMMFVLSAAVILYRQIINAQFAALADGARDTTARLLLDRIESELSGAMLLQKPEDEDRLEFPYLFIGEDRLMGTNDSDAIRFVTMNPARAAANSRSGGLRMVTYAVVEHEADVIDLFRKEEPIPEGMDKTINVDEGQLMADDLGYFRLRYLHDESGEWVDRWDSADLELADRLPLQVEVQIQLMGIDEGGELVEGREFSRIVPLRIRPIDMSDPNDTNALTSPNAPGTGDPDVQ